MYGYHIYAHLRFICRAEGERIMDKSNIAYYEDIERPIDPETVADELDVSLWTAFGDSIMMWNDSVPISE